MSTQIFQPKSPRPPIHQDPETTISMPIIQAEPVTEVYPAKRFSQVLWIQTSVSCSGVDGLDFHVRRNRTKIQRWMETASADDRVITARLGNQSFSVRV